MSMKESPNGKHTAWIVSNCARTNGAKARWAYGQELIKNGLKLDGFGECFGHRLQGVPWNDNFGEGKINKYKFYLGNGSHIFLRISNNLRMFLFFLYLAFQYILISIFA